MRASREEYVKLLLEKMKAPDGGYEEGFTIPGTGESPPRTARSSSNLEKNNPLSLHDENPWTKWFASVDLRKTILQDVERTFPDIGYFRDSEVQAQLTSILFTYSVMHPEIGYRQGMHELLAPLYYAVDYDSIPDTAAIGDASLKEFCSRAWVAADAWVLFVSVMNGVGRWYEWQESKTVVQTSALASHVQLIIPSGDMSMKAYVAPIVEACNLVQSTYLKRVDPELWKAMQNAGIEPQIYGIRWLRLLFTREFDMHDAMIIWDGLFACDPTFDLALWICVAMLIRIRNKLIPSDYSGQLTYLLRYPTSQTSSQFTPETSLHHTTLLLRQALTLQMSPSPTTGVSVIHENKNLLNIPVEVPEPPPPPVPRRPRLSERGQSFSSDSLPSTSRAGCLSHRKQLLHCISLVDERPVTERPPWEPRTRFEMERDVSDMHALQKKLGDSVAWIVDTLLLDEGEGTPDAQAKTIQNRKREALECLSYVRDVLKGTVTEVEEERLISEEESKRRAKTKEQKDKERAQAASREPPTPNFPLRRLPFQLKCGRKPYQRAAHKIILLLVRLKDARLQPRCCSTSYSYGSRPALFIFPIRLLLHGPSSASI
ncbi:TBC1 domain family member 5 [Grifola frondosa]|uniref:TBC1 domain family member 5 n=1 Tax=Grifola frondosa TaxID=5627 RepID=A0A1C7MEC8_GRIFR|nr:TBC1 domain family member 5 [Grifola frondosa]